MSERLRSSQQALCRENKSSLTAASAAQEPFVSCCRTAACALRAAHRLKCLISPRELERQQAETRPTGQRRSV